MKNASVKLDQEEHSSFNQELLSGLFNYLRDKLTLQTTQLNKSTIRSHLTEKGATNEVIELLISVIEECEIAKYAPTSGANNQQLYEQGITIIEKLENELVN